MIILLVMMWFLMIRPQRKKAKEEEQFRKSLKKGDRVTFSGGIYGKIHEIHETTAEVEVSHDVILTVEKSFLQPVVETAKKN
ncbi:MAG: preprotein translocase subunit YajC [Bacteroidales bacterium]|nr:preprotein translocase subunit YajC [Bacteroidales bacterium]